MGPHAGAAELRFADLRGNYRWGVGLSRLMRCPAASKPPLDSGIHSAQSLYSPRLCILFGLSTIEFGIPSFA